MLTILVKRYRHSIFKSAQDLIVVITQLYEQMVGVLIVNESLYYQLVAQNSF